MRLERHAFIPYLDNLSRYQAQFDRAANRLMSMWEMENSQVTSNSETSSHIHVYYSCCIRGDSLDAKCKNCFDRVTNRFTRNVLLDNQTVTCSLLIGCEAELPKTPSLYALTPNSKYLRRMSRRMIIALLKMRGVQSVLRRNWTWAKTPDSWIETQDTSGGRST